MWAYKSLKCTKFCKRQAINIFTVNVYRLVRECLMKEPPHPNDVTLILAEVSSNYLKYGNSFKT